MSEHPPTPAPPVVPAIVEGAALDVLEEILTTLRSASPSLAVTEKATHQHLAIDFPFAGAARWLLPRQPVGGILQVEAEPSMLLSANPDRMGGLIVNAGKKPLTLILAEAGSAAGGALGKIVLAAGDRWDLLLSDLVWCGSVSAESGEGSEVSVAEV